MATFFRSPPFLSPPHPRTLHFSSSSQPPPPITPPPEPQSPASSQQLSANLSEPVAPVSSKAQQQKPINSANSTRNADSTDWIASNLTRRFGIGAGLAWVAFLAVGVVSEQIKTRLEVSQQEANTRNVEKEVEVVLPNGIRCIVTYLITGLWKLKVGGGASPRQGDLVVIDLSGKIEGNGEVFVNTFGGDKKPLALVMGSRPFSKGMCEGIEYVLKSMKAGGKRRVIVPPNLGFGEKGADLGSGAQIPPFATLEYTVEVERVSIAPA